MPLIVAILLIGASCSTVTGFFGKTSNQVQKEAAKITVLDNKIEIVKENKINNVQSLSFGVTDSLNRLTNAPIQVTVAKELNTRIQTLVGLPPQDQQSEMIKLVSNLISNNIAGVQELKAKDKEISAIESEEILLVNAKQSEVDKALELSKQVALKADTTQNELSSYQAYWGLGGVLIGLKSFFTHIMWTIIIGGIIFIILRIAAASNPLANAIFGIFQSLGAVAIHCIESLIPASITTLEMTKQDISKVSTVISQVANTVNNAPTQIATPITQSPSGSIS